MNSSRSFISGLLDAGYTITEIVQILQDNLAISVQKAELQFKLDMQALEDLTERD